MVSSAVVFSRSTLGGSFVSSPYSALRLPSLRSNLPSSGGRFRDGKPRWCLYRKQGAQRTVLIREHRSFRLNPIFDVEYAITDYIVIKAEKGYLSHYPKRQR